jgi:hypothetical protein
MATIAPTSMTDLVRRAQRLQVLTIVWMTAEAMIALASAWTARSPALALEAEAFAFGAQKNGAKKGGIFMSYLYVKWNSLGRGLLGQRFSH